MECGLVATAPRSDGHEHDWLEQARKRLTETLDDPDGIKHVARELGLSHQTFRKTFRRLQGCPPGRYRAFQTMENAARRLLTNKRLAPERLPLLRCHGRDAARCGPPSGVDFIGVARLNRTAARITVRRSFRSGR